MAKGGCLDVLKDKAPDIHAYLEKQAGVFDGTESSKEAYRKAAKDLQEHSLNTIHNIYNQLGVTGFENKIEPTQKPGVSGSVGDVNYENFKKDFTPKKFKEYLNEISKGRADEGGIQDSRVENTKYGNKKRAYGDYLYNQDRSQFDELYNRFINSGKKELQLGDYGNLRELYNSKQDNSVVKEENKKSDSVVDKKQSKQNAAKKVYKDIGEIDTPSDARGLALEYLASGGKINEKSINEIAGTVKRASLNTGAKEKKSSEVKARDYTSKDAPTITEVAHSIWDNLSEDLQKSISDKDIENELNDVVNSHNTRLDAAIEFRDRYIINEVKNNLSDADAKEMGDIAIANRMKLVDELPEDQQKDLIKLLAKYEDKYGNRDWQQLENDSGGFNADILSLPLETIKALDAIIQKNISQTESELGNAIDKNGISSETQSAEEKIKSAKEPPKPPPTPPIEDVTLSDNEGKRVGVSHASLTELAKKLGLKEPERGDYIEPQEYAERGRQLLKAGATLDDVNNPQNDLHDRISIARTHLEDLISIADRAAKDSGIESKEYKDALSEVEKYANDSVKKLGTLAHRAFVSLQGERDLNTGSFTAVKKAFEESKGAKATPEQEKKIIELTKQNEDFKNKVNALEKRLIEETDKNLGRDKQENIGKAKKIIEGNKKRKDEDADLIFQSAKRDFVAARVAKDVGEGKTIEQSIDDIAKDGLIKPENIDKANKYFNDLVGEEKGTKKSENKLPDLIDMFADKKGNKFTPEEAKALWDYAKSEYLDKGIAYKDMIAYVSNDLGLTWKQVYEAITSPKTKRISDEMWRKQADLRRAQIITKDFVEKANNNVFVKALKGVSDLFRGAAVFGHGGIFVGTHAGMTFFDLPRTKYTIKAFLNAWKFAYGNKAAYERQMQALKSRPNFTLAERAGLQNDPQETSKDEYQKFQKVFRFLGGEAGIKGFNAIKILRQDLFDSHFNKLNAAQKADPSSVESITHLVNNATGGTNLNLPKWTQEVAFAANMEAARWEKLTSNPVKATTIALKAIFTPDKATNAEKVFAKVWASRVGWEVATYASILAANAAIQNLLNPNNKVNLTDPLKSDYLKYKVGENTIDMTSGMLGAIGFVGKIAHAGGGSQKSLYGDTRMEAAGKSAIGYARGKLSPFAGTVTELTLARTDFAGNPLPFSSDKPKKGKHTLTWSEYAWQKAPIPVADAAKTIYDGMRENGMDKVQANNWLAGLITMFEAGTTGFRISESYKPKENSATGGLPKLKIKALPKLKLNP